MKRLTAVLALFVLAAAPPAPAVGDIAAAIAHGASASTVLQAWCAAHGLPPLLAQRLAGQAAPPDGAVRAALGAGPDQTVRYRHVRLACGGKVLSEADNWYLPDRLSAAMNHILETTDTPFGLVVRPLNFTRRTLQVTHSADPDHRLEIRAVLVSAAGAPFSYVVEDYSGDLR
jgi:hypothetical protein